MLPDRMTFVNWINNTFSEYKITGSAMTHNNGSTLPSEYEPVLMAIYKGERNNYGIKNARLVISAIGGRTKKQMV